jgi:hypothetical protein
VTRRVVRRVVGGSVGRHEVGEVVRPRRVITLSLKHLARVALRGPIWGELLVDDKSTVRYTPMTAVQYRVIGVLDRIFA